jgi:hypothetical protein
MAIRVENKGPDGRRDIDFRTVSPGAISNVSAMVSAVLSSPFKDTILVPKEPPMKAPNDATQGAPKDAAQEPKDRVNSHFKLVFISVLAVTVACGIAGIVMAALWGEPFTDFQKQSFDRMAWGWTIGLGGILGLIGGNRL